MYTRESQVRWWTDMRFFPTMDEAWQDDRVRAHADPFFGDQVIGEIFTDVAPEVPIQYNGAWRPEAEAHFTTDAWVPFFNGDKTVEQALEDAQQAAETEIEAAS
jgi:ABC-type glycerol-3-phosphate transport system substrate-binding protein